MAGKSSREEYPLWTWMFIRVGIVTALAGVCRQVYMSSFPYFLEQQGFSATAMGLVASGYTIVAMVTRIVSGNLVDKYGRRNMLIIGTILFGIPMVGFLVANNAGFSATVTLSLIVVFRMSQGIGSSLTSISTGTMAPDVLHPSRRSEGIGYYGMFNNLATAVGPAMGIGFLLAGKSNQYFLFTLAMIVLALPFAMSINYEKNEIREKKEEKKPVSTGKMSLWEKINSTLIYKKALPAAAVFAFVSFSTTSVSNFISPYAVALGFENIGSFFTVQAIFMIVARISSGKISKRIGNFHTLQLGIGIDMIGFIVMAFMQSEWQLFLGAALRGLGGGINMPVLNVLAVQSASHDERGKATSTYYAAFDIGSGIGAAVWGVVADMFGTQGNMIPGYRAVYIGASLFFALTMAAAYILIGKKEKEQKQH